VAQVYFTNFRTTLEENIPTKFSRLLKETGIEKINWEKKFAAIKMHFGEPGNLSYLRPNYAKVLADAIKKQGGLPFLTDCNTLYVGRRKNALEHLGAAQGKRF
jgi:uncharacterized Fe-S center protein